MTKLDKLKQAEHFYIYEKQPLYVIGKNLIFRAEHYSIGKRNINGIKRGLKKNYLGLILNVVLYTSLTFLLKTLIISVLKINFHF